MHDDAMESSHARDVADFAPSASPSVPVAAPGPRPLERRATASLFPASSGQMDDQKFSEALAAVDDLAAAVNTDQSASPEMFPVIDRLDELLFDHIDAVESTSSSSDSGELQQQPDAETSFVSSRDSVPSIIADDVAVEVAALGDASPGRPDACILPSPAGAKAEPSPVPGDSHKDKQRRRMLTWKSRHLERPVKWLAFESFQAMILLAPYALVLGAVDDDGGGTTNCVNTSAANTAALSSSSSSTAWTALLPNLVLLLLLARLSALAFENVLLWPMRHTLPSVVVLLCETFLGWPLLAIVWVLATLVLLATRPQLEPLFAPALWDAYPDEENRVVVVGVWLGIIALTRGLLEAALQVWLSSLTLRHFEQRAKGAYAAHKTLRRVAAAARAAERKEQLHARITAGGSGGGGGGKLGARCQWRRPQCESSTRPIAPAPSSSMPASSSSPPRRGQKEDRWRNLTKHLSRLAGPFELGAGFADAPTVDSARKRAVRVFAILRRQDAIKGVHGGADPGSDAPMAAGAGDTLRRDDLIKWAHAYHGLRGAKLHAATLDSARVLPMLAEEVDEDNFVGAVERCYKEQKLLTASVESFSRTHLLLRRACVVLWAMGAGSAGLLASGIDLEAWVVPMASALLSALVLLGRVPTDFAAGATYALVVRPYDIGDRVTIAPPGETSKMYSLIVKHIDLMRTHFITSFGETLILENHIIRTLAVVNLNRSGPMTLAIRVQVPTCTPSAKITELVDSIKAYVAEKDAEWREADLLFTHVDFERGYIELCVWAVSTFPAHEVLGVYSAKSRLLLFVHTYMQSAGIEYVRPLMDVRVSGGSKAIGA